MPIGIITNVGAIFLGGIVWALSGEHMSDEFKTGLNMAFSICSICMGIYAIAPLKNLAAVIFAVIIGTSLGILLHLGQAINRGAQGMQHFISRFITGRPIWIKNYLEPHWLPSSFYFAPVVRASTAR